MSGIRKPLIHYGGLQLNWSALRLVDLGCCHVGSFGFLVHFPSNPFLGTEFLELSFGWSRKVWET